MRDNVIEKCLRFMNIIFVKDEKCKGEIRYVKEALTQEKENNKNRRDLIENGL